MVYNEKHPILQEENKQKHYLNGGKLENVQRDLGALVQETHKVSMQT